MKKLVETVEVNGEGFEALLGQQVTLFCVNYIYSGKLVGVNTTFILLEDASLVFETGNFAESGFTDAQKLPNNVYIQTNAIEMFTVLK